MNRDELVERNQGLVRKFARKYEQRGYDYDDLMQDGNIGLMKAAESYDPSIAAFSTYASRLIVNSIRMSLNEGGHRTIRLPWVFFVGLNKLNAKVKPDLERDTESDYITPEMVAEKLGVKLKVAKRLLGVSKVNSFDRGYWEYHGLPLKDRIADPSSPNPEELTSKKELVEIIWKALDTLEPEEREAIERRFGMNGYESDEQTYKKIGIALSVDHKTIANWEKKTFEKLRAVLEETYKD